MRAKHLIDEALAGANIRDIDKKADRIMAKIKALIRQEITGKHLNGQEVMAVLNTALVPENIRFVSPSEFSRLTEMPMEKLTGMAAATETYLKDILITTGDEKALVWKTPAEEKQFLVKLHGRLVHELTHRHQSNWQHIPKFEILGKLHKDRGVYLSLPPEVEANAKEALTQLKDKGMTPDQIRDHLRHPKRDHLFPLCVADAFLDYALNANQKIFNRFIQYMRDFLDGEKDRHTH